MAEGRDVLEIQSSNRLILTSLNLKLKQPKRTMHNRVKYIPNIVTGLDTTPTIRTPKVANYIHKQGDTITGTSRGGNDNKKIVNSIEDPRINQVYIIGGDGTQKGAYAMYETCRSGCS
ncbi:hypothetical protein Lser_V15G13740 [Lactuca serriola]